MTVSATSRIVDGMVALPGGSFRMGSTRFEPEEAPERLVHVDGFSIDLAPVTNEAYARFVDATGYVTVAERQLLLELPGQGRREVEAGSAVFVAPSGPVPLDDPRLWWQWVPGACWQRPTGPGSSWHETPDHPVVHVAYEDAQAFAHWAGKALPTPPLSGATMNHRRIRIRGCSSSLPCASEGCKQSPDSSSVWSLRSPGGV